MDDDHLERAVTRRDALGLVAAGTAGLALRVRACLAAPREPPAIESAARAFM
jgi:hypothetical protein